jgi:signal transduction histidine kinase
MRRDAETIAELSEELAATFQGLLDEVTGASDAEGWLPRLDDVVAGALRSMGRVHGPDRVVDVVDGSTRRLRCPGYVGRVLGNVLDSALGASPPGEMVRLSATLEEEWIRIRVEDHGRTDRRAGLTVAREVTEALGGAIRLQERGDHGRIATIDLPLGNTRPPAPVAR